MADLKNTYITLKLGNGGGSASGVTPQDVQQQIDSALTPYWDSAETQDAIDKAISGVSVDLSAYWTSAQTSSAITQIQEVLSASGIAIARKLQTDENVISIALNELHDDILELSGSSVDLSAYWTSAETKTYVDDKVASAETQVAQSFANLDTNVIQPMQEDIQELSGRSVDLSAYWTSAETQDAIDEAISGFTPSTNSPIIPAISSQTEYEAISGDVKTGDLIQVYDVDINDDGNSESGLFEANVQEEEDQGVIRKLITWTRRDNGDSVLYGAEDYPWMDDEGILPISIGTDSFLIADDVLAGDGSCNGIGFDGDGKPVITHFAPQYDEGTGEITGITRTDTPIGGGDMSAYYTSAQTENAITSKNYVTSAQVETQIVSKNYITSAATANMVTSTYVSTIWKGTQAEYDAITTKDPNTFYIIVNN